MVQQGKKGIVKTFTKLSYFRCNTRIQMQLQHLWQVGPGTSTTPGCFNTALSQLICCSLTLDLYLCSRTCMEINSDYKEEKSFQFQPKNHTFKAMKIADTDSYLSPITTECPESKTCYQTPQVLIISSLSCYKFSFGRNTSAVPQLKYHLKEPGFMRWKICNC